MSQRCVRILARLFRIPTVASSQSINFCPSNPSPNGAINCSGGEFRTPNVMPELSESLESSNSEPVRFTSRDARFVQSCNQLAILQADLHGAGRRKIFGQVGVRV